MKIERFTNYSVFNFLDIPIKQRLRLIWFLLKANSFGVKIPINDEWTGNKTTKNMSTNTKIQLSFKDNFIKYL